MGRFLALAALVVGWGSVRADFTVTLIHTNDLHAHIEPVMVKGEALGGYARQATLIKRLRSQSVNPVLLSGGDTFQGTLYFNVYQGLADAAFLNAVGYQAAAVGNHEFDRGPQVLADFARLVKFPVLAANLDTSKDRDLAELIRESTIIETGGQRLGVVGAVTPDLPTISSLGETVSMQDTVTSVQAAVDRLRAQGVDKIVLLSHCGYGLEQELARKLHAVDVVVGGHSHTLLGDTKLPGSPPSSGPYPTVVKNADGDTVLVVQSWEWGKVVGKLAVTFDDGGRVKSWSKDQPVAVTADIPEDPDVRSMVSAFKKPIESLMNKEVGTTLREIPRSGPGLQGPMADMICDSMLEATRSQGSVAAFMNRGGIRSALNAGRITYGDAISVQPFNNTLVVVDLTGAEVKAALETGVLLVSDGSSFTFDERSKEGERVSNVVLAGTPLDLARTYRCTFNSFVAGGGDAVTVVKEAKGRRYDTGLLDVDALIDYIKAHSPLDLKSPPRIKAPGQGG